MKATKKKLLLVVMDGVGVRRDPLGNAVHHAHTPTLTHLSKTCFSCELHAHGRYVGLPSNSDMGNSEVGHNALGAGRVFDQGSLLVSNAIESGDLFKTAKWHSLTKKLKETSKTLHLLGLLSDGGVHSHEKHLHALIQEAAKAGVKRIRVHALLDGRDVKPQSAHVYLERLEEIFKNLPSSIDAQIASCGGRMKITMDRYNADWPMVEKGWKTHVRAQGPNFPSALKGLELARKDDPVIIDQDLPAFVINDHKTKKPEPMIDGDCVILFNFRGDRSLEITKAFEEKDFQEFKRNPHPALDFYGMTEYDGDLHLPKNYLVSPPLIENTVSEHLSHLGLRQFACSETQKYGHVTYFWNGNRSGYFDKNLESYKEIPSDRISFDLKPWMKAHEITEETSLQMKKGSFDFARINYPNGDMVGHTGNLDASICAMSTVDLMLGRLLKVASKTNTQLLITADHGNCEEMFQEGSQSPKTSHTLSPVPFYYYDPNGTTKNKKLLTSEASLGNMANTVLKLLDLDTKSCYLDPLF